MGPKTAVSEGDLFRHSLREQTNLKHPPVRLAEALEQATLLSDVQPEATIVDRGDKGVFVDGVMTYHPGLRRGITRGVRAMIRRRSAIGTRSKCAR